MSSTRDTSKATAVLVRRGQETAANRLRAAGWICIPPDDQTRVYVTARGQVWCDQDPCIELEGQTEHPDDAGVVTLYQTVKTILQHMAEHRPPTEQE